MKFILSFSILIILVMDFNWTKALKCWDGYQIRTSKGNLVESKYSAQNCEIGSKCAIIECTSYFGNATSRGCEANCADFKCDIRGHSLSLTMERAGCQLCDGQDLCNSAAVGFRLQQIIILLFTSVILVMKRTIIWQ